METVCDNIFRNWWAKVGFRECEAYNTSRAEGECYKHIRRNWRFSLVANDTFHDKGEKHVFCHTSKGGKVRFSSLRCEKHFTL